MLAFIAIVFALIDGILKLSTSLPTSLVFFAYVAIGTYFLILTYHSKSEVAGLRTRTSQAENGILTTFPTSRSEASRFQVPVQIESMELRRSD